MTNLKRAKEISIYWNKERKKNEDISLLEIETKMEVWHEKEVSEPPTHAMKDEYKLLDLSRRKILLNKEKEWRLRSTILWLQSGDENTNFFHHFAN
jgi:hypothetical protein